MENIPIEKLHKLDSVRILWDAKKKTHVPSKDFEDRLTLKGYVDSELIDRIFSAAETSGNTVIYFVALEVVSGEDAKNLHKIINVAEKDEFKNHFSPRFPSLEAVLIGDKEDWIVWQFHEPCVHIAGSSEFVSAVRLLCQNYNQCDQAIDKCNWN